MNTERLRFAIRASASRLDKGLLAIPQRFRGWFPNEKSQINAVFDDEAKAHTLTFHPCDSTTKESRIFGLARWFSRRVIQAGDLISISVEDKAVPTYRIELDRYVREREEQKARREIRAAQTESEAIQGLSTLSRLTKRRPCEVAQKELIRIARESILRPRGIVQPRAGERRDDVPAGIRILLRELHRGKCQLCAFTFKKRNGEPYFELHHIDPRIGHHPSNLLVVCPNCHAQFEHATIADLERMDNWLIAVKINGKRVTIRQPLAQDSIRRTLLGIFIIAAAAQFTRLLTRWGG